MIDEFVGIAILVVAALAVGWTWFLSRTLRLERGQLFVVSVLATELFISAFLSVLYQPFVAPSASGEGATALALARYWLLFEWVLSLVIVVPANALAALGFWRDPREAGREHGNEQA